MPVTRPRAKIHDALGPSSHALFGALAFAAFAGFGLVVGAPVVCLGPFKAAHCSGQSGLVFSTSDRCAAWPQGQASFCGADAVFVGPFLALAWHCGCVAQALVGQGRCQSLAGPRARGDAGPAFCGHGRRRDRIDHVAGRVHGQHLHAAAQPGFGRVGAPRA